MANAQHVEQVIVTRIKMARRWFGLRTDAEMRDFVLAGPDVRTLCADQAMRQQIAWHLVRRVA